MPGVEPVAGAVTKDKMALAGMQVMNVTTSVKLYYP
jgi:hypothetical protein